MKQALLNIRQAYRLIGWPIVYGIAMTCVSAILLTVAYTAGLTPNESALLVMLSSATALMGISICATGLH